jgi:hypothetical protein
LTNPAREDIFTRGGWIYGSFQLAHSSKVSFLKLFIRRFSEMGASFFIAKTSNY